MGKDKTMVELMHNRGKLNIEVQLLTKRKLELQVRESSTVRELVDELINMLQEKADVEHFWLYMGYIGEPELTVLEEQLYVGELQESDKDEKPRFFLFKRRLYSHEWRYTYKKESAGVVNDFYCDLKYEYLLGNFFVNDAVMMEMAARMLIIDAQEEAASSKFRFNDLIQEKIKSIKKYYRGYIPAPALKRSFMQPEMITSSLKALLNEKVMKKEHTRVFETKVKILEDFEDYPEFMSSNFMFIDRNRKSLKVSFNILSICVEGEDDFEKVRIEQIISIVPKSKFLFINYDKKDGITGKLSLFSTENRILAAAQDLLAYCMLRIRMLSPTLYGIYRYERLYESKNDPNFTKDKEDQLQRMKSKFMNLTPTVVESRHIPYFNLSKYIKVHTPRKLYANALNNLAIEEVDDKAGNFSEEEADSPHNVFSTLFPKVAHIDEGQAGGKKSKTDFEFDSIPGKPENNSPSLHERTTTPVKK